MPGRRKTVVAQHEAAQAQLALENNGMPSPPRTRFRQQNEKQWREDEIEAYKATLAKHGKDWAKIVAAINGLKNPQNRDEKEVKEFFDKNNRRGHKLGKILTESRRAEKNEEKNEAKKVEPKKEPEAVPQVVETPKVEPKVEKKEPEVKVEPVITPVTSPTRPAVVNSPSLALPTVPGISPPRPKLDSPKPRTPPHSRPTTPKAPIELPILPGIRPSLPTTPTSPVTPARTPSTSPHTPKPIPQVPITAPQVPVPVPVPQIPVPTPQPQVARKEPRREEKKPAPVVQPPPQPAPTQTRPVGQVKSKGVFIPPVGLQASPVQTPPVQPGMKRKTFDTPKSPPPTVVNPPATTPPPPKQKANQVIHVPFQLKSPPVVTQVVPMAPSSSKPKVAKSSKKEHITPSVSVAAATAYQQAILNKNQQMMGITPELMNQAQIGLNYLLSNQDLKQATGLVGVPGLLPHLQRDKMLQQHLVSQMVSQEQISKTIQNQLTHQHQINQMNAKILSKPEDVSSSSKTYIIETLTLGSLNA